MQNRTTKTPPNQSDSASVIALQFMAYLASEGERLERFCAISGALPNDLKSQLDSPEFQAALLDYALQDESLLLAFAAENDMKPDAIVRARSHLPGFAA